MIVNVSIPVVSAETAAAEVVDDVIVSCASPHPAVMLLLLWLILHLHHTHWYQLH